MGNSSSTHGALVSFYAVQTAKTRAELVKNKEFSSDLRTQLCREFGMPNMAADSVSGGADLLGSDESVLGGVDDLVDYGNSVYSKAKEKLIRDIAEDVLTALKAKKTINCRTAPISDVVNLLTKSLPPNIRNPRKFHDSFNSSSASQKHVCRALATAINKHYSGALIDLDGNESDMCGKIAEIMYSLLTGLHTEFMNVAGDVMRVMNNMQLAQEFLERAYKKQKETLASSGDPQLRNAASETDKVYEEVKAEYNRQSAILANLMNVAVGPTGKSLISSLEDNRDFVGLVKNLKAMTGTKAFGDKLAHLLSGISSVAHSADLIERALRKIQMSVQDFKNASNAGELRSKVFKHIMDKNPSSQQLDEMMAAARIIYEANYDHDAISKALSKKGGDDDAVAFSEGGDDVESGDDGDEVQGGDDGDDGLPAYWKKKSLKKKIDNKKKYRDLVLADFRKQLRSQLRTVIESANQISRGIGSAIPVSDELRNFVEAFARVSNLDEKNLHVALSGYPNDSVSKEQREMFLLSYDLALKATEPLLSGPQGHLFKAVHSSLQAMVRLVDDFRDKMVKALTEIHIDRPEEVAEALRKTASMFYGAGDSGDDSFGSGSWVSFDKVKNEMQYFFSIAHVKTNLARNNVDIKSYADDYEQILGEEAGWIIDRIKEHYKLRIEALNNMTANYAPPAGMPDQCANVLTAVSKSLTGNDNENKDTLENYKTLWSFQMNAKINMIKVAQAVDLYLKAFTDGIAKDPDSLGSIVKMLNGLEIVGKWFNERSGDNLAALFDVFPSGLNADSEIYSDDKNKVVNTDGLITLPMSDSHYYLYLSTGDRIDGNHQLNKLPGNPYLGRPLDGKQTNSKQCKGILQLSQKVIKSMRALENILSAFSSVGSKFGDVDLLSKTFMKPGQIFNALCDYVAASAFTHEFLPVAGDMQLAYDSKTTDDQLLKGSIPLNNPNKHRADKKISQKFSEYQAKILTVVGPVSRLVPTATQRGILTGVALHTGEAPNTSKNTRLAMSAVHYEDAIASKWKYQSTSDAGDDTQAKCRVDVAGWRDNFYDTDMLFEMSVKAIVAKVFTVVDAYRLFNRPVMDRRAHYSLNPLRTILGGADGQADGGALMNKVKVIPEAIELYYRLVLLAEWYREMFGVKSDPVKHITAPQPNDAWRVTIVPSIDGIWSDFINVVFEKADYIKDGNYTETQCQRLIVATNDIWKSYKARYPKSTTRHILNAFVLEMNRAFGFLRQSDIQAYLDDKRSNLSHTRDEAKETFLDYDILDAEDAFPVSSRPAPSDRFTKVGDPAGARRKEINMMFLQQAIETLRKRIDVDFLQHTQDSDFDQNTPNLALSFAESLRQYRNELANAKSDQEEYKVVLKMLQGSNRYIAYNADNMVMVHEMVAAPLVVVYACYKVLARFNALCHGTSINNLAAWNAKRSSASTAINNSYVAKTEYSKVLVEKYNKILNDKAENLNILLMTRALAGSKNNNKFPSGYLLTEFNGKMETTHLDTSAIVQDLLAAVLDLSTHQSKLVTVSIGQAGTVNLDYSALEEACKDLLHMVKENIKKLRATFGPKNASILDQFEHTETLGSTRWLEENFVQQLLNDRDECGLPRAVVCLNATLKEFTSKAEGNPNLEARANQPVSGVVGDPNAIYSSNDNAVKSILFYGKVGPINRHSEYNINKFPGNAVALSRIPQTEAEKSASIKSGNTDMGDKNDLGNNKEKDAWNAICPMPVIGFENDFSINQYNISNAHNTKSLLQTFNKLLHMYLYTSVEEGNNKFYGPLVESFAMSAGSLEIIQGKAFPNVFKKINNNLAVQSNDPVPEEPHMESLKNLQGPPESTVVYASNALIIKSLLNTTQNLGSTQRKVFLYESLVEMPEYLKERLRVNLPYFSKMFENLANRVLLMKSLLNDGELKNSIKSTAGNEKTVRDSLHSSPLKPLLGLKTAEMSDYVNGLLTKLTDCAYAMRKCADNVYRELQDKPVAFFETSKDFLQDYRTRNGGMPFMPFSSILLPLNCYEGNPDNWTSTDISHLMMPVKENGSNVYKFNFATRLLLNRGDLEPQMDHFPGAKQIYNLYATNSGKVAQISPAEYTNTLKHTFKLAKFLLDGAVYNRLYDGPDRYLTLRDYRSRNVFQAINWGDSLKYPSDLSFIVHAKAYRPNVSNPMPRAATKGTTLGGTDPNADNEIYVNVTKSNLFNTKTLQANMAELQDTRGKLQDTRGELQDTIDKLAQARLEILRQVDEIKQRNDSNEEKQVQLNSLQDELQQMQRSLEQQIKDSEYARGELQNARISSSEKQQKIQELEKDIKQLQAENENIKQALANVMVKDPEVTLGGAVGSNDIADIKSACCGLGADWPLLRDTSRTVVYANVVLPDDAENNTLKFITTGHQSIAPLVLSNVLSRIIEMTENPNMHNSKDLVAKVVQSSTVINRNLDRPKMRVLNILDAGIVPLNVHAFMREVPFANLFNYSYTYDRMIHDFILPNYINTQIKSVNALTETSLMMASNTTASNTREMLVKLLVHPHAMLDSNEYFGIVASLFNGNDDMKLGRPRYLSDQLWHKVLLTSSVQSDNTNVGTMRHAFAMYPLRGAKVPALESGPAAYEAVRMFVDYGRLNANASQRYPDQPVATTGLKYQKDNKWVATNVQTPDVIYLAELGRMRFDTKLVRNLVWFTQIQRVMRVVLTNHLSWINTPVVRGLKIADQKITEFEGNDQFDENDFNGMKYSVL